MSDIALVSSGFQFDLKLTGYDLQRDDGFETAVFISLFTDRRAIPEQIPDTFSKDDLRGYWGDVRPSVSGDKTGSLLWLLAREKQVNAILGTARGYVEDALKWMIEDTIADKVVVQTSFVSQGWMAIYIDIYKPNQTKPLNYRFDYAWQSQAVKRVS